MKIRIRFIAYTLYFLALPLFALDKIDLVKYCTNSKSCKPHLWYVEDSFNLSSLFIEGVNPNSTPVKSFPIRLKKFFPNSNSMDFTLTTEFSLSEDFIKENNFPALYLDSIGDVYSIYLNGNLIAKEGRFEKSITVISRFGKKLAYPLNRNLFQTGNNKIVIHIEGNPQFDFAGLLSASGYYIGDYSKILFAKRDRIGLMLIFFYLFVSSYHLIVFLFRRKEFLFLFFSIFSFFIFIYTLTESGIFFEYGLDSTFVYRFELSALFLISPFFGLFLEALFFNKNGIFFKLYTFFSISLVATSVYLLPSLLSYSIRVWQFSLLIAMLFYLHLFYKAIRANAFSSKKIFASFCILISFYAFTYLDKNFFHNGFHLFPYAFFVFVTFIVGNLINRFFYLRSKIEFKNKNLELEIKQKNKEIEKALFEISQLKEAQTLESIITSPNLEIVAANVILPNPEIITEEVKTQNQELENSPSYPPEDSPISDKD